MKPLFSAEPSHIIWSILHENLKEWMTPLLRDLAE